MATAYNTGGATWTGSIGIGTTNPTAAIHVVGNVYSSSSLQTTNVNLISATLAATPVVGEVVYNGTCLYSTVNTTNGRGYVPVRNTFYLSSDTGAYPSANYFFSGTSTTNGTAISLEASSTYEVEMFCYYLKTTTGTTTFQLNATSAPYLMAASGYCGGGLSTATPSLISRSAAASSTLTFGAGPSITTGAIGIFSFKVVVITNLATTLGLYVSVISVGTMTSKAGSYYTVTKIPVSNSGNFV